MESQVKSAVNDLERRYDDQNIPKPPQDVFLDQIREKLIIEELQLQLADRAGVKISDAELNQTLSRLAYNNEMSLEEFITFVENDGASYEDLRDQTAADTGAKNEIIARHLRAISCQPSQASLRKAKHICI